MIDALYYIPGNYLEIKIDRYIQFGKKYRINYKSNTLFITGKDYVDIDEIAKYLNENDMYLKIDIDLLKYVSIHIKKLHIIVSTITNIERILKLTNIQSLIIQTDLFTFDLISSNLLLHYLTKIFDNNNIKLLSLYCDSQYLLLKILTYLYINNNTIINLTLTKHTILDLNYIKNKIEQNNNNYHNNLIEKLFNNTKLSKDICIHIVNKYLKNNNCFEILKN